VYDSICRDLALQTGFAIVFPEYTLAPEARYPSQQEQCYAVLKWVSENGHKQGLSTDAFAIVGDSAGGMLQAHTWEKFKIMLNYFFRTIDDGSHHPSLHS